MEINNNTEQGYKIVNLSGRIDRLKDSIKLKRFVNELLDSGKPNVAFSLKDVSYVDSGAINVIVYTYNAVNNRGGKFAIIEPTEYVLDVIKVVGITKIIKIYLTKEEFKNAQKST